MTTAAAAESWVARTTGNQVIGNVFDGRGHLYSIVAFSVHNWVIQHNTFYAHLESRVDRSTSRTMETGFLSGNLVRDNVFTPRGHIGH